MVKSLIDSIIAACFIACIGLLSNIGSLSTWIIATVIITCFVWIILYSVRRNTEENEELNEIYEMQEMEWRLEQNRKEAEAKDAYKQWHKNYIERNGIPDKTIVINEGFQDGVIYVHETNKIVFLEGNEYKFSDIISCSCTDTSSIIKGGITSTTKSDTGSVIGRAIVGELLGGDAGAVIAGMTAASTTEFHQEEDIVLHDFTVVINVNSISNPLIRIHTGSDKKLTEEIIGLMNVIISRN